MDDIQLTKDIYPSAAAILGKKPASFGRKVERIANRCWDYGDHKRLDELAGRKLLTPPSVKDYLIYLAFYSRTGVPFFVTVHKAPSLLFEPGCLSPDAISSLREKNKSKKMRQSALYNRLLCSRVETRGT